MKGEAERDAERLIYRVRFEGAELDAEALARLASAGARWEGTHYTPGAKERHRARVRAEDPAGAVELVRAALGRPAQFGNYRAELVVGAHDGLPWRGAFDPRWEDVDWSTPQLAGLRALHRAVIGALLDDHEATWIIAEDPDVDADAAEIEDALAELEALGIVDHRVGLAMNPAGDADEEARWWALTNRAWDLLGIIKSPTYRP